ncbi:unnamed protein product [Withania somnifera]
MLNVLAIGFDEFLVALLRQILGGDFSEGNLWLCLEMVTLFLANRDCLFEEEPLVLNKGLYAFLQLLTDHYKVVSNPMIDALKRMEVEFCVRLLREQFCVCLMIGRDLIRLLQDLVRVPEFRAIWKDLLLNPRQFGVDEFKDISQIYRIETPSLYFLFRVTPEMETKLSFLLTHVNLGSQKRHLDWFAKKFFGVPERETVLTDIVRFICCSVHPSSEIMQPGMLPRWAVIGWLLTSRRKSYDEANLKLALFYDWLFFDETTDNVMNIEPAILLMVNSIPNFIEVTHTLLDFLPIVANNYDVERKEIISKGVGVVSSLDVFTRCDMIAPVLREMFGELVLVMQGTNSKRLGPASINHDMSPPSLRFLSSSLGSQHPNKVCYCVSSQAYPGKIF